MVTVGVRWCPLVYRWCPLVSVGVRWCLLVTVGDRQPLQERLESGKLYRLLTDFTGGEKKIKCR